MGGCAKGSIEVAPGLGIAQRLIEQFGLAGIDDVVIVSSNPSPYEQYGRPIIPDVRSGMGPMGGVEAALGHFAGRSDATFFLPCDLPRLAAEELRKLLNAFDPALERVVYARTSAFFDHPLCSIVHNGLLPEISAALDRGERSVGGTWRRLGGRAVVIENDDAFLNLNTYEDVHAWRADRKASE